MADHELDAFIKENERKIGTMAQVLEYAISLCDHYERLDFLEAVQDGSVAVEPEWRSYQRWLELGGTDRR